MLSRTVLLAGRAYRVASLTLAQVEEFIAGDLEERDRAWYPVHCGLANAGCKTDPRDLDVEDFRILQQQTLDVSGLLARGSRASEEDPDFDYLRARLATHCHWTVEECDRAPFVVIMAIFDYWQEVPPVDATFSSWIGFRADYSRSRVRAKPGHHSSEEDQARLVAECCGHVHGQDHLPTFMQELLFQEGLMKFGPN